MDGPGSHLGARAKMPGMPGGVHRTWNRNRALGVNRRLPADAADNPVRGGAAIRGGRTTAQLLHARKAVIGILRKKVAEVVPGTTLRSLYI